MQLDIWSVTNNIKIDLTGINYLSHTIKLNVFKCSASELLSTAFLALLTAIHAIALSHISFLISLSVLSDSRSITVTLSQSAK